MSKEEEEEKMFKLVVDEILGFFFATLSSVTL